MAAGDANCSVSLRISVRGTVMGVADNANECMRACVRRFVPVQYRRCACCALRFMRAFAFAGQSVGEKLLAHPGIWLVVSFGYTSRQYEFVARFSLSSGTNHDGFWTLSV